MTKSFSKRTSRTKAELGMATRGAGNGKQTCAPTGKSKLLNPIRPSTKTYPASHQSLARLRPSEGTLRASHRSRRVPLSSAETCKVRCAVTTCQKCQRSSRHPAMGFGYCCSMTAQHMGKRSSANDLVRYYELTYCVSAANQLRPLARCRCQR